MRSLRVKIALAMALLALFATTVVGAISYRSTSSRLLDEVDRSIVEATNLLAAPSGGRNEGQIRVPSRGLLGIYSVRLIGASGQIISGTFDADVPVTAAARAVAGNDRAANVASLAVGGDRLRVHTIGRPRGAVQVARSLGETDRVLRDVRNRTAMFVLIVSLIAAGVGWLLAGTVAAPLRKLTRVAADVEQSGDLDVRFPPVGADEVGRLGHAFQSMLDALRRSQSEQQRLVQDAGHELRTPLTSLRTNLSVLRRHPDLDHETTSRIYDDLDGEVTELTDLVNELVSVASGDLADQPSEQLDLGTVAETVAERVARRRERQIVVHVRQPGSVVISRSGLERAITNLIQNAAKFDQSGAPIEVHVDNGSLSVLDRGPGIDPADLPLVFERFHRAEAARSMPGSGLGLAIVREIIERHGGTVRAANRAGGGAEVGFELPPSLPEPVLT